jgi:hypothetical protein
MVMMTGSLSVRGTILWLTPQQGGRVGGPPALDYDHDYTATAFLPPRTPRDGQAGIALSAFAPGAWRSIAEGSLVADENTPTQHIWPGCVLVVTEGERPVAYLSVDDVTAFDESESAPTPTSDPPAAEPPSRAVAEPPPVPGRLAPVPGPVAASVAGPAAVPVPRPVAASVASVAGPMAASVTGLVAASVAAPAARPEPDGMESPLSGSVAASIAASLAARVAAVRDDTSTLLAARLDVPKAVRGAWTAVAPETVVSDPTAFAPVAVEMPAAVVEPSTAPSATTDVPRRGTVSTAATPSATPEPSTVTGSAPADVRAPDGKRQKAARRRPASPAPVRDEDPYALPTSWFRTPIASGR